mmetsp:Transcript_22572/g.51670  ORF Transcript_22572/g.51670 Transcript_22572/m.51670 type:complete len:423 (+) Transcript_22572:52-1320(+)
MILSLLAVALCSQAHAQSQALLQLQIKNDRTSLSDSIDTRSAPVKNVTATSNATSVAGDNLTTSLSTDISASSDNVSSNATSSVTSSEGNGTSEAGVIEKIVFIKLHSVGSSTMTSILHHYCELHDKNCFVYPVHLAPGSTLGSDDLGSIVAAFSSSDIPDLDIWPNHVVMETGMFEALIPGNFMISLFRDPFDRIMSSFRHGDAATVLATMESLKQNFKSSNCGAASYAMAKQLTPEQVEDLDLVMLTEEYDFSLMLLRRALGWSMFDMLYRRLKENREDDLVNATTSFAEYLSKPLGELNTATREYLAECMGADETAVYLSAKTRFQRQWEDLDSDEQQKVLDDTAKFQSTLALLEECCESHSNDSYCIALLEDNVEWNQRYQNLGHQYTTMQLDGTMLDADITQESSCKVLVKSALDAP